MKTILEFSAGILLCSRIRDFLEACRFKGMKIEWREGRGWLERDWIVCGSEKDINTVQTSISDWIHENKLDQ